MSTNLKREIVKTATVIQIAALLFLFLALVVNYFALRKAELALEATQEALERTEKVCGGEKSL